MEERTLSRLAILFGLVGTLAAFASISGGTVPLVITVVAVLVAVALLLTIVAKETRAPLDEPEPRNP